MNRKENHIDQHQCNCQDNTLTEAEIISAVEDVVRLAGTDKEKVILILQEVQKRLNYLPSEALKHICRITEITPGQISGVSTFYSQFRHMPAGRYTIKICAGTACHVKGAPLISDAFKRALKIEGDSVNSPDGEFSIEEVACLGCCTLAPVVQIDGKTYGHVKPTQADEIINDFLSNRPTEGIQQKESEEEGHQAEVRIGIGSCCVAGGSMEVLSVLQEIKHKWDLNIYVKPVGCVGVCNQTPLLEIIPNGSGSIRYTNVKKEQVEEILLKHIKPRALRSKIRFRLNDLADTFISDDKIDSPVNLEGEQREKYLRNFLSRQVHMATLNSGILSPVSIDEYLVTGGFDALRKCMISGRPAAIRDEILRSGLRGRGGAGFATGRKWEIFAASAGDEKFVICNGDEGDPGAFMDRMLLESFPFRIIEGMLIAGYATGASEGIFYIRAEYPLAVARVRNALDLCREKGFTGEKIFGSDFSFRISIFEGAGAFVCGEETALIASLEGKRGTPHIRPPYPAVRGFRGKPTLVNNVETFSLVPWIINNGAEVFSATGTEKSKGTKVFALAGKVSKGGLVEVPMGISIRDIVENTGGGVADGRTFKAVQIGGPSGGCIPAELCNTPVDYEELSKMGAMMGSGGMVVLDDADCMVDMAKYFLTFTHRQSCGKCTFCRVGTKRMLDIITKLSEGRAGMDEIRELEELCFQVRDGSLCGLGRTAPNPVITGLRYFREEYEAHTKGRCPAKKCSALIKYQVTSDCTGCTKCSQECPVNAIPFTPYQKHEIDQSKCTKCDTCRVVCPVNAIEITDSDAQDKD